MALIDYVLGIIRQDEEGQGLAEYALILALIALVAIAALLFLGPAIAGTVLNTIATSLGVVAAARSDRRDATGQTRRLLTPHGGASFRRSIFGHRASGRTTAPFARRFSGDRPAPADARDSRGKEVNHHMSFLTALIDLFRTDEEGQGLAEYALILALIALVAIAALLVPGRRDRGHPRHVATRSMPARSSDRT